MEIYINGVDITGHCDVLGCEYTDAGGGECDTIELRVRNTTDFNQWLPAQGDVLRVAHGKIDSGAMPIDTMWPGEDGYTMYATAMPESARWTAYQSYYDATVGDIALRLSRGMGLTPAYYGIDPGFSFKYCARDNETAPEFLERILTPQAGVVKFAAGRLVMIGLNWARAQKSGGVIELRQDSSNFSMCETPGIKMRTCTVSAPYGTGAASDTSAKSGEMIITRVPVFGRAAAAKWAQGALALNNWAACECVVQTDLAEGVYAMGAYETAGATTGKWVVYRATHDLKNERSEITLRR